MNFQYLYVCVVYVVLLVVLCFGVKFCTARAFVVRIHVF